MDFNQILWPAFGSVIGAISAVIWFFVKRQITEFDAKLGSVEQRVTDMERDHISKSEYRDLQKNFQMLQERLVSMGENIIEEIHKTQLYSANTFVKKEECDRCRGGN